MSCVLSLNFLLVSLSQKGVSYGLSSSLGVRSLQERGVRLVLAAGSVLGPDQIDLCEAGHGLLSLRPPVVQYCSLSGSLSSRTNSDKLKEVNALRLWRLKRKGEGI